MTISVIIPAYNEEKYLATCLQSLLEHTPPNSFLEIIVVDNASTDNTEGIARQFPGVTVVKEPRKGLTHARQRGLMEARGTHLAYLDADTRIPPGWLKRVQEALENEPELVALSGPYDLDDMSLWQRKLVRMYWLILAVPAHRITGYALVGGNFVARKDALEKIGGFNTAIAFYGEDTNIARRLYQVGKVHFDRNLFVFSSGRRLAKEGLIKMACIYVMNYLSEVLFKKQISKHYTDIR